MITSKDLKLHYKWVQAKLRGESDGVRLMKAGADLADADLAGVNLSGAYFTGTNLAGADLTDADLTDACFMGADLTGAILTGANCTDACFISANLTEADLTGSYFTRAFLASANLTNVDLTDATLAGADIKRANLTGATGLPVAADAVERLKAVAIASLQPDALEMSDWHTCGTTHCIAGRAIYQAGEPGRLLESVVGADLAGLLLLGTEAHRHFYDSNEEALEYLRGVV